MNGLNGEDVRNELETAAAEKCMICGRPPREGWKVEAILSPPAPDGFRRAIGWVHPKCMKQRVGEVLEHLEGMLPSLAIIDRAEAGRVLRNVRYLGERLESNDGYFNAVTHEVARVVRWLAEQSGVLDGARSKLAFKLIEALGFLGQSLFSESKPGTLLPAYPERKPG